MAVPPLLGALDGKRVAIKCPSESNSVFYNYKGYFCIILLALVDADYKFIWVDVGANGSTSDGFVYRTQSGGHWLVAGCAEAG